MTHNYTPMQAQLNKCIIPEFNGVQYDAHFSHDSDFRNSSVCLQVCHHSSLPNL